MKKISRCHRALEASKHRNAGFTLLEVIGVLAVIATLAAIIAPNVIDQLDRAAQEAEKGNLQTIGQGVEMYLRENKAWPGNLVTLSPDFVPFGNVQISQNARGFPRYFSVHPNTTGFSNATGLTQSQLADARFLLISSLSADVSPTISNATQFNNWWDTDETTTPNIRIYRGQVGKLFHLLSVSAMGAGGSYEIDGTNTNSGGDTLTSVGNYHLVGTLVQFDEENNFSSGNVSFGVNLASDAGYQFDPNCTAGARWHVLGMSCS